MAGIVAPRPEIPIRAGGQAIRDRLRQAAPLVGIFALAFVVRAFSIARGSGLFGDLGYDDGVYYASAVALVHGALPYRDFLFVQPPGITVLLAPFAVIGTLTTDGTGMALARVAFVALGASNAVLVALVAGRASPRSGLLAGAFYATWYGVAGFEKSTLLIPPQTGLLLGAMWLLGDRWSRAAGDHLHGESDGADRSRVLSARRAAAAGCLMGLAVAIQLWAIMPTLVVAVWLALRARSSPSTSVVRVPIAFLGGAIAAGSVVCLPFLLISGGVMLRYVVADQIGRPDLGVSLIQRLRFMEGLRRSGAILPGWIVAAVAATGLGAITWTARRIAAVRIWAVLFVVQSIVILTVPVFFPHYAAWAAAAAAIALGSGAAETWAVVSVRPAGRVLAGAAGVIVLVTLLVPNLPAAGVRLPLAVLARDLSAARCTAADEPTLLVELGLIGREIGNGCPVVVDPTAVAYDTDRGHLAAGPVGPSRQLAAGYQEAMEAYYTSDGAALFMRRSSDGLAADGWSLIRCRLPVAKEVAPVLVLLASTPAARSCPP